MKIVFKRLILPGAANVCSDTLKFSWGRIYLDSYSRTFCGSVVFNETVVMLFAKFLLTTFLKQEDSDSSNFEITISRISENEVPDLSCPTPSPFGEQGGILSFTGYPLISYNLSCDWTIDAGKGYLLLVQFLRARPSSSGIDLYDGNSLSSPQVNLVQGVFDVAIIIITTGRYLYMRCGYERHCGLFSFMYTLVPDVGILSHKLVDLDMASRADSFSTITYYRLSRGRNHIFKAESDKNVNNKLGWVILANKNDEKIRITLKDISLKGTKSCANDYLLILDGIGNRILTKLCHKSSDIVLQTSASSVEIVYVNTNSFQSIGLTMEMESVGSGCDEETYRCPDTGVCTYLGSLCNGVNDCNKNQDEGSHFCSPEKRCGIPTYWPDAATTSSGVSKNMRIVGGYVARPFSYPWLVSISVYNQHLCGGTIINRYWVLTAAHCKDSITDKQLKAMTVKIGWHDLHKQQGVESGVSSFEKHKKYNLISTYNNDIALIKLTTPIDAYTDKIRPLCLPEKGATSLVKAEAEVTVAGWGAMDEAGTSEDYPSLLHHVSVKVFPQDQCSKSYTITNNMFCAGKQEGLQDSCQGDSGGPLIRLHNGRFVLIGIVSFGTGCARAGKPGVYTKVENYLDWIEDNAV